jgi:hypothetical protein
MSHAKLLAWRAEELAGELRRATVEYGFCGDGYMDFEEAFPEVFEFLETAKEELRRLDGAQTRLERELALRKQAVERYAPCPDHAGKAAGGCLLCQAELTLTDVADGSSGHKKRKQTKRRLTQALHAQNQKARKP